LFGWTARREAIRAAADSLPLLVRANTVEVLGGGSEEWAEGNGELPSMMGRARAQTLSKTWTNIGSILARYTQALVTDEPFAGEISE